MKPIFVLVLVAFARASPFEGGMHPFWGHSTSPVSHQVADTVTHHAHQAQISEIEAAIQDLQGKIHQQQGYGPYGWSGQTIHHPVGTAGVEAVHELGKDIAHQTHHWANAGYPGAGSHDSVDQQLHDVVQASVSAQRAVDELHQAGGVYGIHASGFDANHFQSKIQNLIHDFNEEEVQQEIHHHRHWVRHAHHLQQFVHDQVQQIESEIFAAQGHGVPTQHVHQVHSYLQGIEHHLVQLELAHQMAILQLEKVLVHHTAQNPDVVHGGVVTHPWTV